MSVSTAVRVDGLGKRYPMTVSGTAQAVSGGSARRWLKERVPWLRLDEERDWFWALRDLSFELQQGEVLGIIGRNGAGKSTLLKILSGIVAPTTGRALLVGRVGSLLEIGTGFHPDLSGRENVFLSAALLGISRADVRREFDAIVDYSGVGAFIDVPVKRYSSGMYMRLAYSVTALLKSDILLLDEVLAVGDAEFQKKTQRSVDAISNDGRTVLFVSHSMASIKNICTRCVWLERGRMVKEGPAEQITDLYLRTLAEAAGGASADRDIADAPPRVAVDGHDGYYELARESPVIKWVETLSADGTPTRVFRTGEPLRVRIGFDRGSVAIDYFAVDFHTMDDRRATATFSHGQNGLASVPARGIVECLIPEVRLASGDYALILEAGTLARGQAEPIDSVSSASQVRVSAEGYLGYPGLLRNQGHLAQRTRWTNKLDQELADRSVALTP